jgi:hypothetical protein
MRLTVSKRKLVVSPRFVRLDRMQRSLVLGGWRVAIGEVGRVESQRREPLHADG